MLLIALALVVTAWTAGYGWAKGKQKTALLHYLAGIALGLFVVALLVIYTPQMACVAVKTAP